MKDDPQESLHIALYLSERKKRRRRREEEKNERRQTSPTHPQSLHIKLRLWSRDKKRKIHFFSLLQAIIPSVFLKLAVYRHTLGDWNVRISYLPFFFQSVSLLLFLSSLRFSQQFCLEKALTFPSLCRRGVKPGFTTCCQLLIMGSCTTDAHRVFLIHSQALIHI